MAFRGLKNFFNVNIKDGAPGKAIVQSSSMPDPSATSYNVSMWLDVYVPDWEPYRIEYQCMVKSRKHPWPGQELPVTVDRADKNRLQIEWDEIQTVDERMAAGTPGSIPGMNSNPLTGLSQGGAQVIDTRDNPELREQVLEMLSAQGITVDGPAQTGAAANSERDPLKRLETLAELHKSGALTDAEFAAQKTKILGEL